MAWANGPFSPLQSALRAQSAQIAANDQRLRQMRDEGDEQLLGLPPGTLSRPAAVAEPIDRRPPWWRRITWWRR